MTPPPEHEDEHDLCQRLRLPECAVSLARLPIDPQALDAAAPALWPPALERAVPKRRREFLAGRLCARAALRQAGQVSDALLPIGQDRLPVWPAGWRGSISHSTLGAVAVVAPLASCQALGIDMEAWIEPVAAAAIASQIASVDELAQFDDATPAQALTRLFSAKEALFKALYPEARRFLDFDAASVERPQPDRLQLRLRLAWSPRWPAGSLLEVRQALTPSHVYSLVYLAQPL